MYKLFLSVIGASLLVPSAAFAGCGGAGQACLSWAQVPAATAPAQMQTYPAQSYAQTRSTHHNARRHSSQAHLAGLAPGESLCPVSCDVNVHTPNGGTVLDCYEICKTQTTQTVYAPQTQYRLVRVVRPVVYVQPATVYAQTNDCHKGCTASRYGY